MSNKPPLVSQLNIKLDGTTVQPEIMTQLVSAIVDQHAYLPAMFALTFRDSSLTLLDSGPFDLTKTVIVEAEDESGKVSKLVEGEITALEPVFREGMIAEVVMRGFDKSHRLFRETKSKAFLNKKDSDLASDIAQVAGLQADVETTQTVYEHIFQHNQTDLTFLTQRAWRIGFECYVTEGKLVFRKPPVTEGGLSLAWGQDLLSFQPKMTLAEQANEVIVRGWDFKKKEAIVGRATTGSLYPKIKEAKDGATWSKTFGNGKVSIVNQPVISQAEANTLATARLNELSGTFVEAEGEAIRRPDIRAGRGIEITGLGNRFSGKYLITSATHVYTPEGLKTHFSVRGARTGLLSETLNPEGPLETWPGAVVAIVTNTEDPKKMGRVKVKYPWLTEEAESDWVRIAGPGAGKEVGFFALPEVNDEVLVIFEHGDFNYPFILGGLWNGKDAIPPEPAAAANGEKPLVRTWRSRKGHRFTVYDNPDNKIEIETGGKHKILMDDANKKITITSGSGSLKIILDDNAKKITIDGGGEIEVKAGSNLKLQAGGNVDVQASGQVNIKGTVVNIN